MLRRGGGWRIYDVVIENISLVGNYRTQFDGIIKTSSYEELVKRIRTRAS
jgi:phospholipid transport system substrate-binding protein